MRTVSGVSLLAATACITAACITLVACSHTAPIPADAATAPSADVIPAGKTCIMQSGGANVLKLTAPPDFKCTTGDGTLRFEAQHFGLQLWVMPGVNTVDEAVAKVGPQIISEFKEFRATQTADLTIAGSPAKQLIGDGHEADDDDPGHADLILFKVGEHVFVALDHGEVLPPDGQAALLALVRTAQMP